MAVGLSKLDESMDCLPILFYSAIRHLPALWRGVEVNMQSMFDY